MPAPTAPAKKLPVRKPIFIPFSRISPNWLKGKPKRLKTHEMLHVNVTRWGRGFRLYSPSTEEWMDLELSGNDRVAMAGKPKVTESDVLAFASRLTESQKLDLIQKIAASVSTPKE